MFKTICFRMKTTSVSQTTIVDLTANRDGRHQNVTKQLKGTYRSLSSLSPEMEIQPWKSKSQSVPFGFWNSTTNQRRFFDEVGKIIGVECLDDWYDKLSHDVIAKNGGSGILIGKYNNSAISALISVYSDHKWLPWKFKTVPHHYWKSAENQRKYFDWLGKELGVTELNDWYEKLSASVLLRHGARGLLALFKNSPISALMAAYPEHQWILWKFKWVPMGFWRQQENKRKFFDYLGQQVGIKTLDEWYQRLSSKLVVDYGAAGLIGAHKSSPAAALMSAYPEHNWVPWKFACMPKLWRSPELVSKFIAELSEKLSIQRLDDWYRVDHTLLHHFGAFGLLGRYNGLYELLKHQYPNHPWDKKKFQQRTKKAQRWLAVTLRKIFPGEEILEDYLHPKIVFEVSKRPMQLDVFIPSKSLAFEYQGKQHYQEIGVFSSSKMYQERDEEKRILCASHDIKLIEVPYWWNRTQESLLQMIQANL